MSRQSTDHLARLGYFLPEESHLQLRRLASFIQLFARLAQPRTRAEELIEPPELDMDALAFGLELLAGQVEQVVATTSWGPSQRMPVDRDASASIGEGR
jgi:hypothetical protein